MKTTTDVLQAANNLMESAGQVTNRDQHAAWWDKKVDVYLAINSALESGAFTGEAHAELKQAQHIISKAELKAAQYALTK
ncbi:hypothetical protein [Phage f2b1]|nr:hypothetical protein [Phage f2b1]